MKFRNFLILLNVLVLQGMKLMHDSLINVISGRPNSSLFFLGIQGDDLIYLDPHHSRPAIPRKDLVNTTQAVTLLCFLFGNLF